MLELAYRCASFGSLASLCLGCVDRTAALELVEVVSERFSIALPDSRHRCASLRPAIMPALHRALAFLLASMHAMAYEPLTRRRIAGLAAASDAKMLSRRRIAGLAAASLAPRVARADEPAVDADMLANIQKSRDAWKKNAARRGFAFEAGASMPFVKDDTVGAPDRSAPSTFGAPRPKSKREIRKEALAEAAASGLPDGWVEVTDDSGRVAFYGNVKTGERQSERPG